ncbi:methyltransferase type 11 [Paraburkholderia aromaticivorans]|uniref:methyltransferase type 11 n=1 Tax=Paraburkholderia aromaticivorans TaxID=2026199 RepID=UPI001F0E9D5D|nr:methyltransferase type 11 [Paraburkholderia aromaticivorans]
MLRKRDVPRLFDLVTAIASADTDSAMLDLCHETLRLYPYRLQTYFHINLELVRRGLYDQLEDLWDESVRRLPNERLPRLFNALMLIALGKLTEGFRRREALFDGADWRGRTTVTPPAYASWRGESLEGKSIVIWSEFGLGDEIFFFRFARIFRERHGAARVTVVCQAPLVELFRASGEAAAICSVDDAPQLPFHDYWVYPHAIPVWASLDIDHLPDMVPYLRAGIDHTPMVLPGNPWALKVGVIFKGAPTHENDAARSLPSLSSLDPLFALEDVEFYIMQKGQGEDEAADYAMRLRNVHDLGPRLRSFGDTAKLMEALDLIISVDTSAANLAGAMGRPLWLMLPMSGDWRWHLEREDSPWYPSARLFREKGRGWPEVVERIRQALIELRNTR